MNKNNHSKVMLTLKVNHAKHVVNTPQVLLNNQDLKNLTKRIKILKNNKTYILKLRKSKNL